MDTNNNQPVSAGQSPIKGPNINNNTLFGVLAYLGPLVLVSFYLGKDSPFVKFHVKQGAVVFSLEIIVWLLSSMWSLWMIINLLNLVTLVLSIIGIINVVQKKEIPLPAVGGFSKYFNF